MDLTWNRRHDRAAQSEPRETTGGNDGGEPVCIGTVEGPLRAEIARSYLEAAGLTVFLQSEAIAGVYGVVGGALGVVRVFVPASQADEAAAVFAELDLHTAAPLRNDD